MRVVWLVGCARIADRAWGWFGRWPPQVFLAVNMGWVASRVVGADLTAQAAYNRYCWVGRGGGGTCLCTARVSNPGPCACAAWQFTSLLAFDLQALVSLLLLAAVERAVGATEIGLSVAGAVLTLAWHLVGRLVVRDCRVGWAWLFFLWAATLPAYVAYKMYIFHAQWAYYRELVGYPAIILAVVALALRTGVVAVAAYAIHRRVPAHRPGAGYARLS